MRTFVNKNCRQCSAYMNNVSKNTQICDDCRKKNRDKHVKNQNDKQLPKHSEEEYRKNFFSVINESYTLTTKGFDEVSEIKMASYRRVFGRSWREVLSMYGKEQDLYQYIVDEHKKYYKETGSQDIATMCKNHKYLTYMIIKTFDIDQIMHDCGLKKMRNSEEDLKNNFLIIKNKLGRIPLFNEFAESSNIMINTYAQTFNFKGKVYDRVVNLYVTDVEYDEYIINKRNHKTEVGKRNVKRSELTDKDYENEFNRVFAFCKQEYGDYPSRRLFNKISKFDDRTYRKRLEMCWLDICQYYGYKIDKTSNKAEKMTLNIIKKLTNVKYEPQKSWDWLRGIYGYPLFCDGVFEDIKLVVEFDGRQHREPVADFGGEERFIIQQQNDRLKDKLLQENGYKMLRISSEDPWYDFNYLAQRLLDNGINIKYNVTPNAS